MPALIETDLPGLPKRRGKVRDVYDLGDALFLVATDRISAFDWVMPVGIPDKGRVLNGLSAAWFDRLGLPNHLHLDRSDAWVGPSLANLDRAFESVDDATRESLTGRTAIVRKATVVPFECVVRGYLEGSGWAEYQVSGSVCGVPLPPGLVRGSRIEPIFTPATKAETGHDQNVSFATMAEAIGPTLAAELRSRSLDAYELAAAFASTRGLILADTKFEWGHDVRTGELLLIDEALTPDSSRYWDASAYRPGGAQPSFDKQFVRDWLETTGWDKASPPPPLPEDVVARTRAKYIEAYDRLTGHAFPWT